MAKLDKMTLRHKKTGARLKVNAFEYAQDIRGFSSRYDVIGFSRGESAPSDVIEKAVRDAELNEKWLRDPVEQTKRGDHRRLQESQKIVQPVVTEDAPPVDLTPPAALTKERPEPGDSDFPWQAAPWFRRRKHVEMITGRKPKNGAEAEEFMADYS